MMPLSYHGFGSTAIIAMVVVLIAGQLFRWLKDHSHRHLHGKK